jgi:hypothetical protein
VHGERHGDRSPAAMDTKRMSVAAVVCPYKQRGAGLHATSENRSHEKAGPPLGSGRTLRNRAPSHARGRFALL